MKMSNWMLLTFIRDRLVNVYNESPNTDFVLHLNKIIGEVEHRESLLASLIYIAHTYGVENLDLPPAAIAWAKQIHPQNTNQRIEMQKAFNYLFRRNN